jgi:dipeptidyl-peptidase-3
MATPSDEELPFIHADDKALYKKWEDRAFEVQVANHELLGHGSGKLFSENEKGELNFDPAKVRLPLYNALHHPYMPRMSRECRPPTP